MKIFDELAKLIGNSKKDSPRSLEEEKKISDFI
jgi:hypothetical protein